mmetsp:Transcript_24569/g.70092  ORF Transcript_24569/g.70092 Transcript_24569/m.70092 type:complete len:646 (+) Transcript_24569:69-2006(+)
MGNVLEAGLKREPEHVLEVRLGQPQVPVPTGRCGRPCVLLAKVAPLEQKPQPIRALWDEVVTARVVGDTGAIVVTILASEPAGQLDEEPHFVAELVIPYGGHDGLTSMGLVPGGAAVQLDLSVTPGLRASEVVKVNDHFKQSRMSVCEGTPSMKIAVRELPVATADGRAGGEADDLAEVTRRDVIELEFETAALEAHRRGMKHTDVGTADVREMSLSHMHQLELIQEDNSKLEREKGIIIQQLGELREQGPYWKRTSQVMQTELDHCLERQQKIRGSYEERIRGLHGQLEQARVMAASAQSALDATPVPVASGSVVSTAVGEGSATEAARLRLRISSAKERKAELQRQMQELREAADALTRISSGNFESAALHTGCLARNTALQELVAQSRQYKTELSQLQQELAQQHEIERSAESQQQLRQEVRQLYEEVDEHHQIREDERVRSESEVRELRKERDAARDRVDDALGELRRLRAKAEALRDIGAMPPGSALSLAGYAPPPSAADLGEQRRKNADLAVELERLQQSEAEKNARIAELEREQEMLVERIGVISSQAVLSDARDGGAGSYAEALEARAREIEAQLGAVRSACEERQAELERQRGRVEETQAQCEALRRSYDELQKVSDERVMRVPQGAAAAPLVEAS